MEINFEYKGRKYFIYATGEFSFLFDITNENRWQLTQWWFDDGDTDDDKIKIAKDYIDNPIGAQKIIALAKKFRETWYENVNNEKTFYKVEDAEHELMDACLDKDIDL